MERSFVPSCISRRKFIPKFDPVISRCGKWNRTNSNSNLESCAGPPPDLSIALGTGTPSHGGFLYYGALEILLGLITRGKVVGMNPVEVGHNHDQAGSTALMAAQFLMSFLGYIIRTEGKSAQR
ncbi:MAG: hypothetical protein CMF67_00980 [Magnetovibrio sp.]|nr:hypothetical protein [Magnetovibrio sp.]